METQPPLPHLDESDRDGWKSSKFLTELTTAPDIESTPESNLHIFIGAATAAEKKNEDSYTYRPNGEAVVSDGVGSSEHGAEASHLVTDYIAAQLDQLSWVDNREVMQKAMTEVLLSAHELILSHQRTTGRDMAATASVLKFIKEGDQTYAIIGNVGVEFPYLYHIK